MKNYLQFTNYLSPSLQTKDILQREKKKKKSLDYSYHKARGENCTVKQYIYIYRTIESKQNKIKIKYP